MEEIKKTRTGVYALILNQEETKVILVKKARGGYKGKLDLPGGGMEFLESPVETLKREVMEEVGIEIKNYELLDVASASVRWEMEKNLYEYLHQVGILYISHMDEEELKVEPDGLDSEGAMWINVNTLKKENLTPLAIHSLDKIEFIWDK